MSAVVQLKLSPSDFKLVGTALEALLDQDRAIYHSTSDAKSDVKAAARAEAQLVTDLINRLK